MKISFESENVHQGGIFSGIFIIDDDTGLTYDYITCSVKCNVYTPGCKLTVVTSVHKMLDFKKNIATIMFTIPYEAPPSLIDEKYQIIYKMYLYIYHGLEKQILKFPFIVNSSYIFDNPLIYKIYIEDDMMRTNTSKDTQFQAIVNKMRKFNNTLNSGETLLMNVKSKVESFKEFDFSDEISKNKYNGDIWFYCKNDTLKLSNDELSIKVQYNDELYAIIYYHKHVKKILYLRLISYKNFKELKIYLGKRIGEELDDTYLIESIDFTNCNYKALEIPILTKLSFSFKSSLFEIEYYLQIHIDDVSCTLPIILIDPHSSIDVS